MKLPVAVVAALSGADELGYMLDCIDLDDVDNSAWIIYQTQMLHHWATIVTEETCYPALGAGLAEFATAVQDLVRNQQP